MNYSMFEECMEQYQWPLEVDAMSLYRAFAQVKDGRHKRAVRYPVQAILTLVLLAKLAGMRTPAAIAEWLRHRAEQFKLWLPWKRKSFACACTYSNVLRTLDAEQLNEVLAQLLTRAEAQQRCGDEPSRLSSDEGGQAHRHLALDGKTLRATLGHVAAWEQKMHQLGLYEVKTGVLLKEQVTGEKQNELSIIWQFLLKIACIGDVMSP